MILSLLILYLIDYALFSNLKHLKRAKLYAYFVLFTAINLVLSYFCFMLFIKEIDASILTVIAYICLSIGIALHFVYLLHDSFESAKKSRLQKQPDLIRFGNEKTFDDFYVSIQYMKDQMPAGRISKASLELMKDISEFNAMESFYPLISDEFKEIKQDLLPMALNLLKYYLNICNAACTDESIEKELKIEHCLHLIKDEIFRTRLKLMDIGIENPSNLTLNERRE